MIIGNLHNGLSIVAARERLCARAKNLGSACRGSLLPAVYRAALAHSNHHRPRHPPVDHSKDAIIYVAVVIVFYAAIILLLVGTNLRRRRRRSRHRPQQLVVYNQKRGNIEHVTTPAATSVATPEGAAQV